MYPIWQTTNDGDQDLRSIPHEPNKSCVRVTPRNPDSSTVPTYYTVRSDILGRASADPGVLSDRVLNRYPHFGHVINIRLCR